MSSPGSADSRFSRPRSAGFRTGGGAQPLRASTPDLNASMSRPGTAPARREVYGRISQPGLRARPSTAQPPSPALSTRGGSLSRSVAAEGSGDVLRRHFFDTTFGGGERGDAYPVTKYYDVRLDAADVVDFRNDHLRYRYVDFLAGDAGRMLVNDAGVADLEDVGEFLARATPHTRFDAYPLYVVAKDLISKQLSGKVHFAHAKRAELEAQLLAANAQLAAAAEQAEAAQAGMKATIERLKQDAEFIAEEAAERQLAEAGSREKAERLSKARKEKVERLRQEKMDMAAEYEKRIVDLKQKIQGEIDHELKWRSSEIERLHKEKQMLGVQLRHSAAKQKHLSDSNKDTNVEADDMEAELAAYDLKLAMMEERIEASIAEAVENAYKPQQLAPTIASMVQDRPELWIETLGKLSHADKLATVGASFCAMDAAEKHQTIERLLQLFNASPHKLDTLTVMHGLTPVQHQVVLQMLLCELQHSPEKVCQAFSGGGKKGKAEFVEFLLGCLQQALKKGLQNSDMVPQIHEMLAIGSAQFLDVKEQMKALIHEKGVRNVLLELNISWKRVAAEYSLIRPQDATAGGGEGGGSGGGSGGASLVELNALWATLEQKNATLSKVNGLMAELLGEEDDPTAADADDADGAVANDEDSEDEAARAIEENIGARDEAVESARKAEAEAAQLLERVIRMHTRHVAMQSRLDVESHTIYTMTEDVMVLDTWFNEGEGKDGQIDPHDVDKMKSKERHQMAKRKCKKKKHGKANGTTHHSIEQLQMSGIVDKESHRQLAGKTGKKGGGKALPIGKLRKIISEVLIAKMHADELKDRKDELRDPLPDFILDLFVHKFGMPAMAKKKVTQMVHSVWALMDKDPRVMMFGQLSGILEKDEFSSARVNWVLDFLRHAFDKEGGAVFVMDDDDFCASVKRIRTHFDHCFEVYNLPEPADMLARLCMESVDDAGDKINVDGVLQVCFDIWEEAEKKHEKVLLQLFETFDADGDGQLEMGEFTKLVSSVDSAIAGPNKDNATNREPEDVATIFNAAVRESQTDMMGVVPNAFITIAYQYLGSPTGVFASTHHLERQHGGTYGQ